MPSPFVTPNMGLSEPAVGGTLSPSWALLLNADMGIIDQHNHTPGFGVQIPPSGLNINADLTFQDNNLLDLSSLVFGTEPGSPANLSLYSNGTDLFYVDSTGHAIQLTANHQPNTSTGNIQGLPSSPDGNAGIAWVNSQSTFNLLADNGTLAANLNAGTIVLRYPGSYPTPSGDYIALQAPSGLATGYALTLPLALPGVTSVLTSDTFGNLGFSNTNTLVPSGTILAFGGTSAPSGYLLCDGTSYSRTTYSSLYSVIGTAYGTVDSTHFNVPDLRGRFLRGVTGASGQDPDSASRTAMNAGGNTGNNVGSVQGNSFQTHDHTITDPGHSHNTRANNASPTIGGANWLEDGGPNTTSNTVILGTTGINGTNSTAATGTNTQASANETRPNNAYVNYIIKT